MLFSILVASALYTASSASLDNKVGNTAHSAKVVTHNKHVTEAPSRSLATHWLAPLSPLAPVSPDTVATYEVVSGMCTNTLKNSFILGDGMSRAPDQVCVKASAPLSGRRLSVDGTDGTVADLVDITTDPQELIFTLPNSTTSVVNGQVVDNRGIWRATVHSSADFGSVASAFFSVADPDHAAADLLISADSTATTTVAPGDPTGFLVYLRNDGPDPAAAVHVTQNVPANMSFDSATAGTGTAFTCSESGGVVDCAPSGNLASGASSSFTLNYTISAGAPNTILTTEIDISSTTTDPHPTSNAATTTLEIRAAGSSPPTCSVSCPLNLTVGANTNQGGEDGAVVNFSGSIESSGDCGTVTSTPASPSFFSVSGSPHTVTVTSSTGGGSCSFTITVTQTAAPTITCAADQTATTSGSSNEASVTVNPPSATGNNVVVTGVRNDNRSLSDGYPIGTTTITWTATECNNPPDCNDPNARFATCTQKIIVTSPDAPTISCPSNKTYPANGCSGRTLTAGEIGSPTATGSNVTVTGERSDSLDLYNDPYPVGTTTIAWTATDDGGRQASCTQTITITTSGSDTTPPTITAPPDVSVTTNSCGQIVGESQLGTPTASDDCGTPTVSRSGVPPGNFFPTGTTTITYTATDGAGNTATDTQTVTVTESPAIPPTITAPADLTVYTGAGATSCGVHVGDATLGNASASDNCPGVTVSRTGVPTGNDFPVGTTTITYTATDRSGNTASDTQDVTVVDNTAPVVTPPANVTAYTGPGATSCGTVVDDATIGTASATDNCPGVGAINRTGVPSGNNFPVGTTTITYSVTDAHGNSASAQQTVTVIDNTVPVITPPANVTAYTGPGATSCGTVVSDATIGTASATDNCPGVGAISRTGVPSGNVFPVGTTTINYSVTDAHGNTGTAMQTVTVIDNTPPVISCPASITLEPTCPSGAIATWTPPVGTDNCPNPITTRTAGGAPGSVFPIGTTTVTYAVTDASNNSTSCSFTVTVKTPQAVIQDLISRVQMLISQGTLNQPQGQGLINTLQQALDALNAGSTSGACGKLTLFINKVQNYIENGTLTSAQGQPLIDSANHVINTLGCTNNPCT
jgi:hypothetical protein